MYNPHKRARELIIASSRGLRQGIASMAARNQMYESMRQINRVENKKYCEVVKAMKDTRPGQVVYVDDIKSAPSFIYSDIRSEVLEDFREEYGI